MCRQLVLCLDAVKVLNWCSNPSLRLNFILAKLGAKFRGFSDPVLDKLIVRETGGIDSWEAVHCAAGIF